VLAWVTRALWESQRDEKRFNERPLARLHAEYAGAQPAGRLRVWQLCQLPAFSVRYQRSHRRASPMRWSRFLGRSQLTSQRLARRLRRRRSAPNLGGLPQQGP
jgi:hypothetical protein